MAQSSIILYDILTGGCFFTPKTNFKEWTYGVLAENVIHGAKLGTFVMEDGSMKTFKLLDIKKAVARMVNNSENGGKAWEPPVFLKRYVDEKVYGSLVFHHNKFMMNSPDLRDFILEKSKNAYRESLLEKSQKRNNLSTGLAATVDSMNTNAKTGYKRWPLKTQVATDYVVTTEMDSQKTILSSTDKHGRVTVQWTTGFIHKYHMASLSMYEVEWDTKPFPLFVRTTANEVQKLVENFKFCSTYKLLQGYVGLDLLWERKNSTPATLQYGYVMPFDPATNKYKVVFRDGLWSFKDEQEILRQKEWTHAILEGSNEVFSFDDAVLAEDEKVNLSVFVTIPETQGDPVDTLAQKSAIPPAKVRRRSQKKCRWTCRTTKIASTCGQNVKYPYLDFTASGWVAGTLMAYDPSKVKPYKIEWDTSPIISDEVDHDEFDLLRRNFVGCNKRRIFYFCVGMDLLIRRPGPATNEHRLVFATVMFYDRKVDAYKLLFRDGTDSWSDGEQLDADIQENDQVYTLADKRLADQEPWSPAVDDKLHEYGPYAVSGLRGKMNRAARQDAPTSVAPSVSDTTTGLSKPPPTTSGNDTVAKGADVGPADSTGGDELNKPSSPVHLGGSENVDNPDSKVTDESKSATTGDTNVGDRDEPERSSSSKEESDSDVPTIWKEGQLLCFEDNVSKKAKGSKIIREFGILAVAVNEESLFGTCVMDNGRFRAYHFSMLFAAVERFNEAGQNRACPVKKLKRLLKSYQADALNFSYEVKLAGRIYKEKNRISDSSQSDSEDEQLASQPSKNAVKKSDAASGVTDVSSDNTSRSDDTSKSETSGTSRRSSIDLTNSPTKTTTKSDASLPKGSHKSPGPTKGEHLDTSPAETTTKSPALTRGKDQEIMSASTSSISEGRTSPESRGEGKGSAGDIDAVSKEHSQGEEDDQNEEKPDEDEGNPFLSRLRQQNLLTDKETTAPSNLNVRQETPLMAATAMVALKVGQEINGNSGPNQSQGTVLNSLANPKPNATDYGTSYVVMALQQQMLSMQNTLSSIAQIVQNNVPARPSPALTLSSFDSSKQRKKHKKKISTEEVRRCSLLVPPVPPPPNVKPRELKQPIAPNDSPDDDEDVRLMDDNDFRKERLSTKRDNDLRNWIAGKNRTSKPDRIHSDIQEATCNNLGEVRDTMEKLGYAIIKDFTNVCDDRNALNPETYNVFTEGNAPTAEQAVFHETPADFGKPPPILQTIFEGVVINNARIDYKLAKPVAAPQGKQARSVMKYGTQSYNRYQEKYKGQAEDMIKGIFAKPLKKKKKNPAADPKNWIVEQNVVVGGVDHQHPHCDQGKAGCYKDDSIFPFVAVHGFGINEFQMWLLPAKQKREYGFLYQFPKNAILFMRGDFIHAGACLQQARAHIHFFPKTKAGWDDDHPYWGSNNFKSWMKDPESFLVTDLRCRPFAYPKFTARTDVGNQTVTYPASLTQDLITPLPRTKPLKKRNRKGKNKKAGSENYETDDDSDEKTTSESEADDKDHDVTLERYQVLKKVRKEVHIQKW